MKPHQFFRDRSEPGERSSFMAGLLIRVEVLALGIGTLIASSFLYRLLVWSGVSERTGFGLAIVFGVTAFWLLSIFFMWAAMEGENRRKAARDRDGKGSEQ